MQFWGIIHDFVYVFLCLLSISFKIKIFIYVYINVKEAAFYSIMDFSGINAFVLQDLFQSLFYLKFKDGCYAIKNMTRYC